MKFVDCHIIGAGGTGSILMEPLIRMLSYHPNGTNRFYIYDGDEYESTNGKRQLFDPKYCGVNKAAAAAERYKDICSIEAVPEYVERYKFTQQVVDCLFKHKNVGMPLIVLTIDSDTSRHEIIKDLDELDPLINFACVLPGNEYDTATCLWYCRIDGKVKPVHPFDVATNYANPSDIARTSCAYEAVSSPQLINANFSSALMANEVIYALLEDKPLPFRINFDSTTLSMHTEGRFLNYS